MSILKKIFLGVGVILVAIQLYPYGRTHQNPSTNIEPTWKSPEDRALVERACFDCHSNLTKWPWYSNVAPVSWLVQHDTEDGRKHLNFSEWNRPQKNILEASEEVGEGKMPMPIYVFMHSEAALSDAEKAKLEGILNDLAANMKFSSD
jgi:Haem-binding domain